MPASILAALVSLSLMWGWPQFAALSMLAWTCLLRPIEFLSASRRHLVLPSDLLRSLPPYFLQIPNPKTRNTSAKQQSARGDDHDTWRLLCAVFGNHRPEDKLWPATPAKFRKLFDFIMGELGLADLTPASFRGGGATALLEETENPPLVQRRGRWLNARTMDIYLQELQAALVLPSLSPEARYKIQMLALAAPKVLERSLQLLSAQISFSAWPRLFGLKKPD